MHSGLVSWDVFGPVGEIGTSIKKWLDHLKLTSLKIHRDSIVICDFFFLHLSRMLTILNTNMQMSLTQTNTHLQEWSTMLSFNKKRVNVISRWANPILKNRLMANCINWLTPRRSPWKYHLRDNQSHIREMQRNLQSSTCDKLFWVLIFDKPCQVDDGRLQWELPEQMAPRATISVLNTG